MSNLRFNPDILSVPEYKGGLRPSDVRSKSKAATLHKLSSNESPYGPSPASVEAICHSAGSLGQYSPATDERLRQGLADAYGRDLSSTHFFTGNGAFEVLDTIARAFLLPGDKVVVSKPTFGVYMKTAMYQGAEVVDVPLDRERFSHDVDGILAAIDANTRLVYICNPNNPSGMIMPAADMARLVEGVPQHTLVVADEVYHDFVTRPDFPDSVAYVLDEKNVIIVRSFSKAYGLAGLRVGYAISRPRVVQYLTRLRRTFHLSTPALEGAIAALEDKDHVRKTVKLIQEEKAWLIDQLTALNMHVWPSQTNFILMRCALPAQKMFEHLLESGVIVRPGASFGLPDCLRITIGVREASQAVVDALSSLVLK